jgi:hypothetical protein
MSDAFDQLGNQPTQPTQPTQAVAQPAPAGDAFDQLPTTQSPPAPAPAPAPPQKSFLQHAKESAQTILGDVGIPNTMEQVREANHILKGQIAHPIRTAEQIVGEGTKGLLQPNDVDALQKSREAWDKGDHVDAARHFLNYLVPMVGGLSDKAGDAVQNKEWGKAVGHTVSAVLPFLFGGGEEAPVTNAAEAAKRTAAQYKETPPIKAATGTEAGPRTVLNTTTQKTAGVEAPISALQQEEPSLVTQAASKLTTPNAAQEFQKTRTMPAAQRQLASTVGQMAEDKINAHEAILNGEPEPEQIAGTQTASKYMTHDEAAAAAKATATKTYQKADTISRAELAQWTNEATQAVKEHKDLIDRHNANLADYNKNLTPEEVANGKTRPFEQFNQADVNIPEKPQGYNDLKAELDTARKNTTSADAVVRDQAWKVEVPKAEKALDGWFKQHSDQISPAEYDSAKKLYADGERFQDIANGLRSATNKGTLSGNTLRGLEANIDNKMIRRGQAPGAFRRLLGEQGYDNWQTVTKLFDPAPGVPKGLASWGAWAGEYLAAHLFGIYGMAGKAASEYLMNRVMFNPEWSDFFTRATNQLKQLWTREHGEAGLPGTVGEQFEPELSDGMRSEFHQLMNRAQGKAAEDVKSQAAQPAPAPMPKALEPIGGIDHDMQVRRRDNGDWEFNHPNGTSQMVLHSEPDTRPGFEGKTQLRQTGISAVDAPGAGQHMMDDAVARMNGQDNTSRIVSDHPDLRSPENEGHWNKLARRGHDVQTEPVETNSLGEPIEDGKVYSINNPNVKAKAPAPPPQESIGPGHNPELEISTRDAGANNPTQHVTGWDAIEQAEASKPGHMRKLLNEAMKYPDLGMELTEDDIANPRKGLEKVINQWAGNLEWLHNKIPASIRNISKLWYDSANKLSNSWADTYDTTKQTAAGVIASLSPKNAWDINAGQAKRMMDMYGNQRGHEWSPEMETELNKAIEKIQPKVDKVTGKLKIDKKTGEPPVNRYKEELQKIRGKTFAELEDPNDPKASAYAQGLWFRMLDQAHGAKTTELYAPDGSVRGHLRMNWGMPEPMAKAVQMLKSDGSTEAIHSIIGDGHKIRNFYNNIVSPNSPNGHATIDTHAGNADMLVPRGSKDAEVTGIFGGAPSHAETGQAGMYSLHHEAYRRAAEKLNILPRELQSITWEGVKSLMGDEKKTPALKKAVSDIWQKHMGKEINLDQAREAIVKAANGFTRPPWMNR